MAESILTKGGLQYFVRKLNEKKANLLSPSFEGTPKAPTASQGDSSTQIANTKFVMDTIEAVQSGIVIKNLVEPTNKDIPILHIDGTLPATKSEVICNFSYQSETTQFDAYVKIKLQGTSSLNYPKKNYTIKLYSDEKCTIPLTKNFKGWGEQQKFCLKANWMDFSHARNICCARLWSQVVESRGDYNSLPEELRNSPANGAVDGFPVLVYCNGFYWGRYTFNIPKGDWMAGMDSTSDQHCILSGENYESGCFRKAATINGNDWSDELHSEVPAAIVTRWNEVIDFVMTSTDEDFKANLSNYFNVNSLIDYWLFSYSICHLDGFGKNQLFFTYDGGAHWIASAYDMDSTIGLYWDGSKFIADSYRQQEDYETGVNGTSNLLYDRLVANFADEIKERWKVLSKEVLSPYNMIKTFQDFCSICSKDLMAEDYDSYTGKGEFTKIPSPTINNFAQIRNYITARYNYVSIFFKDIIDYTATTLKENYDPNSEKFIIENVNPQFASGGYVEAQIDFSNCTGSNYENVLSLGKDIVNWSKSESYHIFYKPSTQQLQINRVQSDLVSPDYVRKEVILTEEEISNSIIKIDVNGVYLNGSLLLSSSALINSLSSYQIGSAQGDTQFNGHYDYIKVFIPNTIVSSETE